MAFDDPYYFGWWRHKTHRDKVAQAHHFNLEKAISKGKRLLRRHRLIELAVMTFGATLAIFIMATLFILLILPPSVPHAR